MSPASASRADPSRARASTFADLTIIVPTLDEAGSIGSLLDRLGAAHPGARVLIADDDSKDGTREVAQDWRGPLDVRVLHRNGGSVRGLTASVVDAMRVVETPHFLVMDADFQHPPEAVLEIYRHASNGADLAVGTRTNYEPFTVGRRVLSRGARTVTRGYLRARDKPLVEDPMSGFFGGKTRFARAVLDRHESEFEKAGFKVLVDFLRFSPPGTVVQEVPYRFGERFAGTSKMRPRHVASLLRQLGLFGRIAATVVNSLTSPSLWKFALVGLSGVVVNTVLLFALRGMGGIPLLLASVLAIEGAIAWNFHWNDTWAFRGARGGSRFARFARFNSHCIVGAGANALVLVALTSFAGVHYLVANLVGIGVAMAWNWTLARAWTWQTPT